MSEVLTKLIFDIETQSQKVVPYSAEEIAQHELDKIEAERIRLEFEERMAAITAAKESAMEKAIAAGLTEDEIAALRG